jgi:uncharacterized protein YecT (DUF1311 family)
MKRYHVVSCWLAGWVLAAAVPAHAQSASAAKSDPCKKQDNTIEINECGQAVLKAKDAELNKVYQELMKSLTPMDKTDTTDYAGTKKELAEAQRAWIKFRDADCSAVYKNWEQGTIRGIKYLACMTAHTEQRTKELRQWSEM